MNRLALIGKDILRSRSQEVYEELLGQKVDYTLIDCSSEKEIPTLEDLFDAFDGVSVTAPYKKFFFDKVSVNSKEAKVSKCLNCIAKRNGVYKGTNTDYLAVRDGLKKLEAGHKNAHVVVLGDGNMSFITRIILDQMNIKYTLLSRKRGNLTQKTNLKGYFSKGDAPIVINTCLREFVFCGEIPEFALFWDYNYGASEQMKEIGKRCHYQDGFELLKKQAQYALFFWEKVS